jgi:hypothetical protein
MENLADAHPRRLRLLEALERARNPVVLEEMNRLHRVYTQSDIKKNVHI